MWWSQCVCVCVCVCVHVCVCVCVCVRERARDGSEVVRMVDSRELWSFTWWVDVGLTCCLFQMCQERRVEVLFQCYSDSFLSGGGGVG